MELQKLGFFQILGFFGKVFQKYLVVEPPQYVFIEVVVVLFGITLPHFRDLGIGAPLAGALRSSEEKSLASLLIIALLCYMSPHLLKLPFCVLALRVQVQKIQ